jgi:hypothetical protein
MGDLQSGMVIYSSQTMTIGNKRPIHSCQSELAHFLREREGKSGET